jgi:hypothetical protein
VIVQPRSALHKNYLVTPLGGRKSNAAISQPLMGTRLGLRLWMRETIGSHQAGRVPECLGKEVDGPRLAKQQPWPVALSGPANRRW